MTLESKEDKLINIILSQFNERIKNNISIKHEFDTDFQTLQIVETHKYYLTDTIYIQVIHSIGDDGRSIYYSIMVNDVKLHITKDIVIQTIKNILNKIQTRTKQDELNERESLIDKQLELLSYKED